MYIRKYIESLIALCKQEFIECNIIYEIFDTSTIDKIIKESYEEYKLCIIQHNDKDKQKILEIIYYIKNSKRGISYNRKRIEGFSFEQEIYNKFSNSFNNKIFINCEIINHEKFNKISPTKGEFDIIYGDLDEIHKILYVYDVFELKINENDIVKDITKYINIMNNINKLKVHVNDNIYKLVDMRIKDTNKKYSLKYIVANSTYNIKKTHVDMLHYMQNYLYNSNENMSNILECLTYDTILDSYIFDFSKLCDDVKKYIIECIGKNNDIVHRIISDVNVIIYEH